MVPWIVAIVLIVTVGLAAAALAQVGNAKTFAIPGLRGLTIDQAIASAKSSGFDVVSSTRAAPDPKGTVIQQSPAAGGFTGTRRVTLVVSGGPAPVAVPGIQNLPWSAAKQALDSAGLIYAITPATRPSETVLAGNVLQVTPNVGTSVPPDQAVTVVLSSGHAPVPVPDVSNKSVAAATTMLEAAHFKVKRAPAPEFSSTVDRGDVIGTDPASDAKAPYGSTVIVHVSKGPDLVVVPDVTFETIEQATSDLASAGLQVGNLRNYHFGGIVMSQDPAGGNDVTVARGSSVDLVLKKAHGNP
jgi:serine/threonine-protein kinase